MSMVHWIYKQMAPVPMGRHFFSWMAGFWAPYSGTVRPLVFRLEPGFCEVRIKDRRGVRNHLGGVHAIALCNMAEFAAGLAIEAATPAGLRWMPRHMTVEYMKKAEGELRGTARFDAEVLEPGDIMVPVRVTDRAGDSVFRAQITMNISNMKSD